MNEEKDEFEIRLDEMIVRIKECQNSHSLRSCMMCEMVFECELRKNYVDVAYNSMSKGKGGDFEF